MQNTESDKQMVGAQIPDRLFQLINLYSFSKGSSKSQVLRDAILLWIESNEVSIDNLIQETVKQYKTRWLRTKNDTDASFDDFIEIVQKELKANKVSPYLIDQIIQQII